MNEPLIIGIGGGKGGVGKSVLAANLSVAIAELGFRTVLVDADLGAANQHTLFGIDHPGSTLAAFVDRETASLEEVVSATGAPRLFLVPGIGAIPGAANLCHAQKLRVLRHLPRLDAEVIVVDVGAGVSFNVLDFWEMADHRLVVTTPQLTAMQNAYCFMKASVHRSLRKRCDNDRQRQALDEATRRSETERLSDIRRRAWELEADLDGAFDQVTAGFGARILGNMVEGPGQRKVLAALSRMTSDFLDVSVPVATCLSMSRAIHESVTRRRPLMLSEPQHESCKALRSLAEQLLTDDVRAIRARRVAPPEDFPLPITKEPVRESDQARFGVPLIDYLRQHDRVEVHHAVRVEVAGRPTLHKGRMNDVSSRGVMLEGALGAQIGDRVRATLVGLSDRPVLTGVVRHVSVSESHFGVELDEISRPLASRLLAPGAPRRTTTIPPVEHALASSF